MVTKIMDYKSIYEYDFGVKKIKHSSGDWFVGCCPLCDDNNPSFAFHGNNGCWKCFKSCGSGNCYQMAVKLNIADAHKYIGSSTYHSNNSYEPHIEAITPLKSEDKPVFTEKQIQELADLKERFRKNCHGEDSVPFGKDRFKGKDDDGKVVWLYPLAIKEIHPIFFEAKEILIAYDNIDGLDGMMKLANHLKTAMPNKVIKTIKWDDDLPKGFDISDAIDKGNDFFKDAISKTEVYELPVTQSKRIFDVMTIDNYYEEHKDKEVEVICENLIFNQGTTLIAGSDNTGKTWVAFHLAFCIALGRPFLNWQTKKKPVLMIQFELRPHMVKDRLDDLYKVYGKGVDDFKIVNMSEDDQLFTDAWGKIFDTITHIDFRDGVLIVDNLYTSTDKDASDNQAIKSVLRLIREIAVKQNIAVVLVAHHNKPTEKLSKEPILTKPLIAGGKIITNYIDNCFQLGISTFLDNVTRGKITKINTERCNIYNQAFKILWDEELCLLEYGGIIPNEEVHCEASKKRWEYLTLVEMSSYAEVHWKSDKFDRQMIYEFLKDNPEFDKSKHEQSYIDTKITRFLKKVSDWGFITKTGHNSYKLNLDNIKDLDPHV